jgi:hypothetical protein
MTDNRLSEAAALAAACADSTPATRLADIGKAITATESEISDLQTALHAAHVRMNKLVDLKSRATDLQKFGPGSAGELPNWDRKNDAFIDDLRALSTAVN